MLHMEDLKPPAQERSNLQLQVRLAHFAHLVMYKLEMTDKMKEEQSILSTELVSREINTSGSVRTQSHAAQPEQEYIHNDETAKKPRRRSRSA